MCIRDSKYIVTEEQTITVPVLREEVRVERDADPAGDRRTAADTGADADNRSTPEEIDLRGERSTTERTI